MRGFLVAFLVIAGGVGLGIGFFATSLRSKEVHLPTTTTLDPQPASAAWKPIDFEGEPPSDVMGSLVIPADAVVVGYDNIDGNVSEYDRSATFFVPAPTRDTLGFYALELPSLGWKVQNANSTPDGRGTRLLAYRSSSDTYQWDLQVSVEPTVRSGHSGTRLILEAYQVDDDDS